MLPGDSLLHYRLVDKIGEGGMGVVWRAVDTTLDREVAIKVLPDIFSSDPERLARFEREAKLLATLSHPNIATVHGLHVSGGLRFLAMELAAGEDLSQRISRGPLPLDEATAIALQVAEALEAAHENGVIHRDLKPANIRVAPDGKVKVLDFGLAKAIAGDPTSSSTNPALSPTITSSETLAGALLGTAAYMSAEQAKGKAVDKRADVWAFGCVLYEMLTGRPTFTGETISETLASVIKEQPDWDALPGSTPRSVGRLLRRCLDKDPRQRLRDVGDARIVLSEVMAGETDERAEPSTAPVVATRRMAILPWALVAILTVLAGWALYTRQPSPTAEGTSTHLTMILAENEPVSLATHDYEVMPAIAVSPSGDRVVYASFEGSEGASRLGDTRSLRVRLLSGQVSEIIRGTEGAELPFFSPDGRWIGFFDGEKLVKVPAGGGAPITIVESAGPGNGASWAPDDTIVYARSYAGGLWRVPADGGTPTEITSLGNEERSHRFPQILPDGKSVLFTVKPRDIISFDDGWIAVADLKSGEHRVLLRGGSYARYVESGHLVYARDGGLLAAPFDLARLEITGGAIPVMDGVITNPVTGAAMMACSRNGTLLTVPGDYRDGPTRVFAVERETGRRVTLIDDRYVSFPDLSPDGRRLVLHGSAANDQVFVFDIERKTLIRVSDGPGNDILPIWDPSGDRVVFTTDRSGAEEIAWAPAGGGGPVETLVEATGLPQDAFSWSADGSLLALNRGIRTARDIWVLDLESKTGPEPFLESSFYEGDPSFSPDGRWIAYTSDETGTQEVFIAPYPGPGGKVQVSSGGGFFPRWRGDGGELYYETETAVMAVPMGWSPGPRPGRPQPLFEVRARVPAGYDVSSDGRHFYIAEIDESHWQSDRIDIVLNWFDDLRRQIPK